LEILLELNIRFKEKMVQVLLVGFPKSLVLYLIQLVEISKSKLVPLILQVEIFESLQMDLLLLLKLVFLMNQ